MIAANEALQRLREGNARFVSGDTDCESRSYPVRREQLVAGQDPFAIVVGCADSRVPVELLFDQGLGELFVIRVAGNVVGRTQLGSIEFAAKEYGTQLVVVLGHTGCGAVAAALAAMQNGDEPEYDNLRRLVQMIRPAAERGFEHGEALDKAALMNRVCRENIRQSVDAIRREPGILRRRVDEGKLVIIGAEYSLATGFVEFF